MRCARAYEEKAESSSSEMEDSTPEVSVQKIYLAKAVTQCLLCW